MSKFELCTSYRDLFLDSDYKKKRKKSKRETYKFIICYKVDGVRKQLRINTHKTDKSEAKAVRDEILVVLGKEPYRVLEYRFKKSTPDIVFSDSAEQISSSTIFYKERYSLEMPLYEALENWRKRREDDVNIEKRTVKSINDIFQRHVIPYFKCALPYLMVKDIILDHFTTYFHLQTSKGIDEYVFASNPESKVKTYKPLSSLTVKKHNIYIATALDEIVSCDPKNNSHLLGVIAKIRENAKKLSNKRQKDAICLTFDEEEKIIEFIRQNLYLESHEDINVENIVVYLGLKFGLRNSEATSLRWTDINFEKKLLCVVNSRDLPENSKRNGGRSSFKGTLLAGEQFKVPKSKAGKREIPFNNEIMKDLLRFKEVQQGLESMHDCGQRDYYSEGKPFVCRFIDGSIMASRHPVECLHKILESVGLSIIRDGKLVKLWFHDLRHTCITRWMNSGIPHVKVQKMSGHSTITALEIYTHHESIDVIDDYHRVYGD